MPLEKIRYFLNTMHLQLRQTINVNFDEGGFAAAKQLQMNFSLQINAEMENTGPDGRESLKWKWYNREQQYFYYVKKTSQGERLIPEDIEDLLKALLDRTGWIDWINSFGHDTSWAFIMGVWSGSSFLKSQTLPKINRAWALQALSYVMENQQLHRIKQVLEGMTIGKNIAFLINQYYELTQQNHLVLKRCAAVALSYLFIIEPSNKTTTYYNLSPVFQVLKEMLSCSSSISDEHIDNAFKIEKELHSRDIRFRAAKALRRLAKKYQIPQDVLSLSLGYLEPIKLQAGLGGDKQDFYLGSCFAQHKTVEKGSTYYLKRLHTYEEDAIKIKNHAFNTGEVEYLYYYGAEGNVYCLRALFYAMTINRQAMPRESKGIALKTVANKCYEILRSQSNRYTFEQNFAAACLLSSLSAFDITQEQFDSAMGYLINRISLTDNQESLIYAQCSIGIIYALQKNPLWMTKYDVVINQKFDNIRVEILHFLTNYIAANTENHQLKIKDKLDKLIKNPNLTVSIAARECLNHLLNKHHMDGDYDEAFEKILIGDLTDSDKRSHAINTILIMIKNQKSERPNNISSNLLTALLNILNNVDSAQKEKIFYIITKLLENAYLLNIAFPTETLPDDIIAQLIQRVQQNSQSETSSLALRRVVEYVHKKSTFGTNVDYIITHLNNFDNILNSDRHSVSVKENILVIFYKMIAYKLETPNNVNMDFNLLMAILLKPLKKHDFILGTLKILNLLAPKITFSSALFEELIFQLSEGKSDSARNIQVLLRNYIRDHQIDKLPHSAILQLAQAIQSEKGFIWIRPILHYLIIEQKYNSNINLETLLAFLDAAENEQEEMSLLGAELLFHAYPSFIENLSILEKIKATLEKISEKGQSKASAFLVKAICHAVVYKPINTNIIDKSFENIIAQLINQAALSIHDREPIYICLAKYSVHATIYLINQAMKDIQSSEKVAIAAISFLSVMLNNFDNIPIVGETTQDSTPKKIIYCLVQHMQRPFLMNTILQAFLSILQKKSSIASIIPQQFIEFCLSLQYEIKSNPQNTEIAFNIITILKEQTLPQTLKEFLNDVFLLENHAKNLLSKPFAMDIPFINTMKEYALAGKPISLSALEYLTLFVSVSPLHQYLATSSPLFTSSSSLAINTLLAIAKNKQIILSNIDHFLINCLKENHETSEVCSIIYHSLSDEQTLNEPLFLLIQEKLDSNEINRSLMIMEIIRKQTFLGKSVTKNTINQLISLMDVISPDNKHIVAFIVSAQIEKNSNLLECVSNKKENRERLFNVLILNRSSSYSDIVRLFKKSFPKMAEKMADYFAFKENAILLLNDSKNRISLLKKTQATLTKITSSNFTKKDNVKKDIIDIVNIIVLNAFNETKKLDEALLNILIQCGRIYFDFIPLPEIFEKIHFFTLTVSNEYYFLLLTNFMRQLIFSKSINNGIKTNCSNILKYIIRISSNTTLLEEAINIFKKLETSSANQDSKTLIDRIKNFNQPISSEKEEWLSQVLDKASHSKISITHDYYREKIHFIVETAQEMQVNLNALETYFIDGFSQNDFFCLVNLFELFKDNPDLDSYGWKISLLINESSNDSRAKLSISCLLRNSQICLILHEWNYEERAKSDLIQSLFSLLHEGWDRKILSQIGKNLLLDEPTHFFEAMLRYKIPPNSAQAIITFSENAKTAIQQLHKFFVMKQFSGSHTAEKSIPELIDELSLYNPSLTSEKLSELRVFLDKVSDPDIEKTIFTAISSKPINEWTETEFQYCAKNIAKYNQTDILIVINQAVKLWASKEEQYKKTSLARFGLRSAQFLTIKCLLDEQANVLGQLSTGEGKSIIIAIIALVKALQFKNIQPDIVVTSGFLAERDAAEFINLFSLFKTTSAHNNSYETEMKSGILPCYKQTIVYGNDSFQFDILKDEFKQLGTRGTRKQTLAIVDEADSVMLDQATNVAKLADYLPGFDQIEFIYVLIWTQLGRLLNGYTITLSKPPSKSLKETLYLYKNDAGKLLYTLTLPNDEAIKDAPFLSNTLDPAIFSELDKKITDSISSLSVKNAQEIVFKNILLAAVITTEEYYEHARAMDPEYELEDIKKALKIYIEHTINTTIERKSEDSKKTLKILYPAHLQKYIQSQIDTWINSAIHVFFNMKKDKNYVIRPDDNGVQCITPVDYSHTGVTLLNTQWSDGIHCFLQLKEGLQLIPEMLTTNFLSNYAFLKRYDQLIGLTGTLGNTETQKRLSKIYKNKNDVPLKCLIFPSHKPKQFFLYAPTLVPNATKWLEKIIQSIEREVSFGRAILVINETIEDVKLIDEAMKNSPLYPKVTCFKRSDEDMFETNNIILDSKRMLFTTNLGARAIDPKPLESVLKEGGVHLIITSLAESDRLFEQSKGRTSRNGNPGTAELILNTAPFSTIFTNPTLADLEEWRDKREQEKLADIEEQLEKNQLNDILFLDFCKLLKEMKQKWDGTQSTIQSFLATAKHHQFCIKKEAHLLAIIERWGLWLKKMSLLSNSSEIKDAFTLFSSKIKSDDTDNKLIRNPCYLLQQNNSILQYLHSWKHALVGFLDFLEDCHGTILSHCRQITDPLFISQARAMEAYVTLTANAGKTGTNRKTSLLFKEAFEHIQDFNFPQLLLQQHFLKQVDPNFTLYGNDSPCDFSHQIENKISVLSTFARAYEQAFKQLNAAQKLIEIKIKDQDAQMLTKDECLNQLKQLTQIINRGSHISLRFHDLRLVYDLAKTVRDEPVQVISALKERGLMIPRHKPNIIFEQKTPSFYHDLLLKLSTNASKIGTISINIKRKNGEEISENKINTHQLQSELNNIHNIISVIIPIQDEKVILTFISLFYLEISEAIIEISSLNNTEAVALLEKINLMEEEFKKTNIRDISTIFCSPKQYQDIHHLMSNGFYYFFELTERQPLQFYTMALLGTIAVSEILIGTLLLVYAAPTVFGLGLAIGLIADGIAEAFEIIKVGVTREHNWLHYGIQKTISLGLIFATAGISSAIAISSAKAKSAASAAQKTSNVAAVKGAELADDITTKTATGIMSGKMTSKTIAHKTLTMAQQEALKTAVKTTVNCTVNFAVDQLGEVFTPHVYAAFERKILNLLDEMVHKTMMEHIIDIKYMLAYAEITHMAGFDFREKRELEAKIRADFKQQFSSLMSIKSLSLLRDSVMTETAQRSINIALMHIFEQQRTLMSIKSLIEYFFKKQNLDTETTQKNVDDVINILKNNNIIEIGMFRFPSTVLSSIKIDWEKHSHLSIYGNAINALYQEFHQLVYNQSNQTNLINNKSQGVRDVIHGIISSALLTEVSKAVNLIESGIKGVVKSLPNVSFTPSSISATRSLFEAETWRHLSQVIDPRRFESPFRISGEYLGDFLTKTLTSMKLKTDYHNDWVEKRNAMRLSIQRMHGNDGTHHSVTDQLADMATPEQEVHMAQVIGLSFTDRNVAFNESIQSIIQNDGIGQIIAFIQMDDKAILALKNSTGLAKFLGNAKVIFDHLDKAFSFVLGYLDALYTIMKNFGKNQSEAQLALQSAKYMEILTYEPLWKELSKYADKIPDLYLKIRTKVSYFKQFISPAVFEKLERLVAWPEEAVKDFLTIFQFALKSSKFTAITSKLFHYQNTDTMTLRMLLSLLSFNLSNGNKSALLATHLTKALQTHFRVLLDHLENNCPEDYAFLIKRISFPGSSLFLTIFGKEWLSTFVCEVLSLFNPIETPSLYLSLKKLIPIYGNDSTMLYLAMLGQMSYENKLFHQKINTYLNIHYIMFDDLFYDINLALIAYTKLDNKYFFKSLYNIIEPIFRVINQITCYIATFFIIENILWQNSSLTNKSLLPTLLNVLLYTTLLAIDSFTHHTKKHLDNFYPAPKTTFLSSLPVPSNSNNSAQLGNNHSALFSSKNQQPTEEPIIKSKLAVANIIDASDARKEHFASR